MSFLLMFWKPIAAVAAVIVLAIAVMAWKHSYDGARREEGRAEVQAEWDLAKAAALKASNEQEGRWQLERDAREKAEKERDDERQKRAEMASERARTLPAAVASVRVPERAARVLRDAVAATRDTAEVTGSTPKPAEKAAAPADATLGPLIQWSVACVNAYEEARGMVAGWQDFYRGLQATQ